MRRLKESKLRIISLSFSEVVEELLPVSCSVLSSKFDDIIINVGEHWMLNIEFVVLRFS